MANKFIQKRGSDTVYYRMGDTLRAIRNPADFARLNGGNTDIAGSTDLVDNFSSWNKIGDILGDNDINNIANGLYVNPLSTEEQQSFLEGAKAKYAPSKASFADLISGKIKQGDLDFEDTKTRLGRESADAIGGANQDLSNRGFLRSGEQVGKTARFKEDEASNVQKADIQREISRANLLLQQMGFESDLDKQAITDAGGQIQNELSVRGQNAGVNQEALNQKNAQEMAAMQAEQLAKENALKLQLAELQLKQAQASGSGSGGGSGIAALLSQLLGGQTTNGATTAGTTPGGDAKSNVTTGLRQLWDQLLGSGGIPNGYAEKILFPTLKQQYQGQLNDQDIWDLIYDSRKQFENASPKYVSGTYFK